MSYEYVTTGLDERGQYLLEKVWKKRPAHMNTIQFLFYRLKKIW